MALRAGWSHSEPHRHSSIIHRADFWVSEMLPDSMDHRVSLRNGIGVFGVGINEPSRDRLLPDLKVSMRRINKDMREDG